jgi:N-acetylneuraminate synthase
MHDVKFLNQNSGPFFVAEISGNHNGDLKRCLDLITLAKDSGADAVKFQTFKPESMTLDIDSPEFKVSKDHVLWGNKKLIDLYRESVTPRDWFPKLFKHAEMLGIMAFSTPFDIESVDYLETLGCPVYKIASLETSDLNLIQRIIETKKPLIVSTGATLFNEINDIWELCRKENYKDIVFLVCTSSYPAVPSDAHLRRLEVLKTSFSNLVGISDHTLGIGTAIAAISLGAKVVEKHFIDSRSNGGLDSQFSMEPHEFKTLVEQGKIAYSSLGSSEWAISKSELESRRLRRSLYIATDVCKSDLVTQSNIVSIRPGYGLAPKYLKEILGKKFKSDFPRGTALKLEYIE